MWLLKSPSHIQTRSDLVQLFRFGNMYMVVSLNRGAPHRPQYTVALSIGNPTKGTPNFGNPPSVIWGRHVLYKGYLLVLKGEWGSEYRYHYRGIYIYIYIYYP